MAGSADSTPRLLGEMGTGLSGTGVPVNDWELTTWLRVCLAYLSRMSLDREEAGETSVSFPKLQDVASSREPSPPQSQAALAVDHP